MNYYEALELKLRRIVEKRLEEGWIVQPLLTLSNELSRCCLIGAIGLEVNPGVADCFNARSLAAKWLQSEGVGDGQQYGIPVEHGFESAGGCVDKRYRKLIAIGARIRRDYCEWTNE